MTVAVSSVFTLPKIGSNSERQLNAVTTVGTTNGVQGVKVAPVDVVAGQTYTIKEAAAGGTVLTDYTKSATCKTADGTAVTTTGSNGTWSVTIPSGAMDLVSCEIKNVAKGSGPAAGSSKVELLNGNDYLRVWVNRGGTHYLVHLVAA